MTALTGELGLCQAMAGQPSFLLPSCIFVLDYLAAGIQRKSRRAGATREANCGQRQRGRSEFSWRKRSPNEEIRVTALEGRLGLFQAMVGQPSFLPCLLLFFDSMNSVVDSR